MLLSESISEAENLSYRGMDYIRERSRHVWNRVRARTAIALHQQHPHGAAPLSLHTVLETLSIEHAKALAKYVPRPYSGDVVLFRASKQLRGLMADEYLGWRGVLRGDLEVCEVPGHQQNLMLEPHVQWLAKELTSRLEAAQDRYAPRRSLARATHGAN